MPAPKKPKKTSGKKHVLRGKVAKARKPSFRSTFDRDAVNILMADGKKAFHIPSLSIGAFEMLEEKFRFVKMNKLLVHPE